MKELICSLWLSALIIIIMINFNLVLGLYVRDYNWIIDNWINGICGVILINYYIILHLILILGYKTAIKIIRQ